jgi:hypothetical protein
VNSGDDGVDPKFGEILTMALMLLIMLAAAHLENFDFVVTAMSHHGALDDSASDERGADFHRLAFAYHEDLIERDFCANFCRYLFYFEFLASANAILLAAGFYDRIHELNSENKPRVLQGTAHYTGKTSEVKALWLFV